MLKKLIQLLYNLSTQKDYGTMNYYYNLPEDIINTIDNEVNNIYLEEHKKKMKNALKVLNLAREDWECQYQNDAYDYYLEEEEIEMGYDVSSPVIDSIRMLKSGLDYQELEEYFITHLLGCQKED